MTIRTASTQTVKAASIVQSFDVHLINIVTSGVHGGTLQEL